MPQQISDLDAELTFDTTLDDELGKGGQSLGDGSQLPPFPDLRALNLAYNKVELNNFPNELALS